MTGSPAVPSTLSTRPRTRWRTVDIVVASAIAAVFGIVFFAWNNLWSVLDVAVPAKAVIYGVWVMAGVVGGLVVRRPGAALYTEFLAGLFSALVAVSWSGASIIVYGLIQGLAAELVFAAFAWKRWNPVVAVLAGAVAGFAASILDLYVYRYYPGFSGGWQVGYIAVLIASGAVVAGLLSWLLVRSLAATGVLDAFASGRERRRI